MSGVTGHSRGGGGASLAAAAGGDSIIGGGRGGGSLSAMKSVISIQSKRLAEDVNHVYDMQILFTTKIQFQRARIEDLTFRIAKGKKELVSVGVFNSKGEGVFVLFQQDQSSITRLARGYCSLGRSSIFGKPFEILLVMSMRHRWYNDMGGE